MSDSESIKARTLTFIRSIGSNPNRFQETIGVSSNYFNSVKNIGADKISKIIEEYPQVNPEWLLTGRGDMLRPVNISGNTGNINAGTVKGDNINVRSGVFNKGTIEGAVISGDNNTYFRSDERILQERIKFLELLLEEKERTIQTLLKRS